MKKSTYPILFVLVLGTCTVGCGPTGRAQEDNPKKAIEEKAHNESTKSKITLSPGRNW